MKRIRLMGCLALTPMLVGCASFGAQIPSEFTPNYVEGSQFTRLYAEIADLHSDYVEQAESFSKESRIINGLSATSAIATLAFAGFDAHPDNALVSTIATGVSAGAAANLKPGTRATLRIKAASALRCIASKAGVLDARWLRVDGDPGGTGSQSIRSLADGVTGDNLLDKDTVEMATAGDAYETLDGLLFVVMSAAQSIESPPDELVTAIGRAQTSRVKLASGIQTRRNAYDQMSDSILQVKSVVDSEVPPNFASFVQAISSIQLPEPSPVPGAGAQGDAADIANSNLLSSQSEEGGDKQAAELAVENAARRYAFILNLLSHRVDQLAPDEDAGVLVEMQACVAAISAS